MYSYDKQASADSASKTTGCGLDEWFYTTCRVNIFLFVAGFDIFLDTVTLNSAALLRGLNFRSTNWTSCL